jgi:hypothetical protein
MLPAKYVLAPLIDEPDGGTILSTVAICVYLWENVIYMVPMHENGARGEDDIPSWYKLLNDPHSGAV